MGQNRLIGAMRDPFFAVITAAGIAGAAHAIVDAGMQARFAVIAWPKARHELAGRT